MEGLRPRDTNLLWYSRIVFPRMPISNKAIAAMTRKMAATGTDFTMAARR